MTPKYEQLVQRLRAALPQWYADGQRKLPGEQALAAQLSVSRQTLRQALAVLEQEGLIEKRRGSGSFLCPAAARQDRRIAVIATLLSDCTRAIQHKLIRHCGCCTTRCRSILGCKLHDNRLTAATC